jgi:ribosomal protein L7Ae-like RNA K-turn-binding protein
MAKLNEKLINLLTVARKAGKLIFGFEPVTMSIRKCLLILVTTDISERTLRKLKEISADVPILEIPLTKIDLQNYFRKSIAIVAVCDSGFKKSIEKLLSTAAQKISIHGEKNNES